MAMLLDQPQGSPVALQRRPRSSESIERSDCVGTGTAIPDFSNRQTTPRQPCAWPTLHHMPPPETPLGERFYCRCSRSSAAKAPPDTAFKPRPSGSVASSS